MLEENKLILGTNMNDLSEYLGISLSNLKYKVKNSKIELRKVNIKAKELKQDYIFDKSGVIIIDCEPQKDSSDLNKDSSNVHNELNKGLGQAYNNSNG